MASHLTLEERDRIASLRHQGADQKEISRAVGLACSTIRRELRRNCTGHEYLAGQAQRQAECRRRERPLERKMERPETNAAVRHGLSHEWSPEQIAGRLQQQHPDAPEQRVSAQTIYTWIDEDEQAVLSAARKAAQPPER